MARRVVNAARPVQQYTPAFSVEKLDGTYKERVARMEPYGQKDRDGRQKHRIVYDEVEKPRGYLVHTPIAQKGGYERNGSVHIDTLEKLEAMGLADTEVPLVDEDGEAVGSIPNRIRSKTKETVNA